jgi:hypothetical protein
MMFALAVLLGVAAAQKVFPLTFSGNAETDFPVQIGAATNFAARRYPIIIENDLLDVGTPPAWPFAQSGWDMKDLRFAYDYQLDQFHMAINCFGVCGDADGDGDPSTTSMVLQQNGGQDLAAFQSSESCAIAFDVGNPAARSGEPDTEFDFVLGYPAQAGTGSDAFPCGAAALFDQRCFGLYRFNQARGAEHLGQRFVYRATDPLLSAAFNFAKDRNPTTSRARPDIEWSVENFNQLRVLAGVPEIDRTGVRSFALNVAAFCGSFQDDGVGEDTFPNDAVFRRINWPCFVFDACDICGGDGSTCRDCRGIPNGPNRYDECDICGGNGRPRLRRRAVRHVASRRVQRVQRQRPVVPRLPRHAVRHHALRRVRRVRRRRPVVPRLPEHAVWHGAVRRVRHLQRRRPVVPRLLRRAIWHRAPTTCAACNGDGQSCLVGAEAAQPVHAARPERVPDVHPATASSAS